MQWASSVEFTVSVNKETTSAERLERASALDWALPTKMPSVKLFLIGQPGQYGMSPGMLN
jgi:hypothetical protein